MCNDCDQGNDEDQFNQLYDLIQQNSEGWHDTYLSRDQKWSLYYVYSNNEFQGWHFGLTDDLGKSLLHAHGSADCPSHVGYNTHYAFQSKYWTYFNHENNSFVRDDGLDFTCVCGKRSLLSSGCVVLTPY